MSESRQLILRALARLVNLGNAGAQTEPEEPTPVLNLSEDALIRALEDAAQHHTSDEEIETAPDPADQTPIIDLGVDDELPTEEPTVDAPIQVAVAEPPVGESNGAGNGAVVQVGIAPPAVNMPVVETPPIEPEPVPEPQAVQPVQPITPIQPTNGAAESDSTSMLLESTIERLKDVRERDDIARVVLSYSQSLFARSALFVMKREMVAGWEGVGPGMAQKTIRAILIPLSTPSVFKTVYETRVLYYGGVPHTTVNDLFLNAIGSKEPPARIIALPFVLKGKVVCALYADGDQADDLSPRMIGQLYQLGRAVSGAFEQLILRTKRR